MKEWILFVLFAVVGLGMLGLGLFFMNKEKRDPESVRIYRTVSVIGIFVTAAAVLMKFVL